MTTRPRLSALFGWRSAIVESDLIPSVRLTALVLSLHMSERGDSCFPSIATLAAETAQSESTVKRSLTALESAGWITRERARRPNGSDTSTRYTATVPQHLTRPVDNSVEDEGVGGHGGLPGGSTVDGGVAHGGPPIGRHLERQLKTNSLPRELTTTQIRNGFDEFLAHYPTSAHTNQAAALARYRELVTADAGPTPLVLRDAAVNYRTHIGRRSIQDPRWVKAAAAFLTDGHWRNYTNAPDPDADPAERLIAGW